MEVPHYALVQVEREIRFGWVAEHLGRRRRIVLEDGSERVEAAKRILYEWEGEPVESEGSPAEDRAAGDRAAGDRGSGAAQDQLREQARRAKQPPAGFDGIALHARLKPGQSLDFATLAALVLGEAARGWARAGLYYALLGASGLFRRSREGFAARSGVELKQQAERAAALRSHQDWLEQVGAWLQALEAGNWSPGTGPEAAEFLSQLESLVAFEGRSPHWKALVQPLELPAHDWEENRVKLKRWLEAAGAWKGWGAVWLRGAGVTEGFAPELEARARVLAGRPLETEGRTDYRGLETISLDSAGTLDVDDACTILEADGDELEIAVHIADPAHALAPDDPLFEEAARRMSSMYTAEGIFPMLSPVLSNSRFSLRAGEDRETLTFRLRIGASGVELLAIEPSLARVSANLDYGEGAALLDGEPERWGRLARLCGGLAARRAAAGALMVKRREVAIDRSDPDRLRLRPVAREEPVHRLVEELAILVNCEAGGYCSRHELPAFYRVQPGRGPAGEAGAQWPATRFSLNGAPHAGLACARYVQVTSPIRRFTDLVMERQLAHHARTGEPVYRDIGRLKDWMQLAEQRFTVYRQLERRIEDHWKRRYLMQNPGFEGPGVVRRGGGAGRGKVWLEDLLLDAEASLPAGLTPRQRGRFRVIEVDLDRHRVRVEHVGDA